MVRQWVKGMTIAGLLGLAVLNADSFSRVVKIGVGTFRNAARIA